MGEKQKGRFLGNVIMLATVLLFAALAAFTWAERSKELRLRWVLDAEIRRLRGDLQKKESQISRLEKALHESQALVSSGNRSAESPITDAHSTAEQSSGNPKQIHGDAGVATSAKDFSPQFPTSTPEKRVLSVKKFLPLTEEESGKLVQYFQSHEGSGQPEVIAQAIETELGKEKAETYRSGVQSAFQRAEDEDNEKEVVFLSRKLSLSSSQEDAVRGIYKEADALNAEEKSAENSEDRSAWLQKYLQSLRARRALIDKKLSEVLTPEQYQAYSLSQAQSVEQDLHLVHE